jgi:hypothetical protein
LLGLLKAITPATTVAPIKIVCNFILPTPKLRDFHKIIDSKNVAVGFARRDIFGFYMDPFLLGVSYSLPSIKIAIKNQELALRRFAPQRLIFNWEGSKSQIKRKIRKVAKLLS